MCIQLPPGDLNPGPCLLHPKSTYTCGLTIAPKVCGDKFLDISYMNGVIQIGITTPFQGEINTLILLLASVILLEN